MDSSEPDAGAPVASGALTTLEPPVPAAPPGDDAVAEASASGQNPATLAAIVVGMFGAAVYRRGAFYPPDAFGVAIVSVVVAGMALHRTRDRLSLWVGATMGGLALWLFVRTVTAHRPAAFLPIGAAILGFLASYLAIKALSERDRRRAAMAIVAIASVAAAVGVVGVLWHVNPLAQRSDGFWQLGTLLTQPGAAAGVFALAFLLALALETRARLVRLGLCVLAAGFVATQSHWSLVALGAGALFVPLPRWRSALWPIATGVVAGVVLIARASSHLGTWEAALLLLAVIGTSAFRTWPGTPHRTPRVAAIIALVVVAGAFALLVLRPPAVSAPVAPTSQGQTLAWSAAAHTWRSSALAGVAPPIIHVSSQPVDQYPGLTPDTYLTVLADGGVVGAVLLLGAIGGVVASFRRRDLLTSCATGAAVAFAVVGFVDVDWQLPAVALLGGCVAGLATAPATVLAGAPVAPVRRARSRLRTRHVLVPVAVVLLVTALIAVQTGVGFSRDAGSGLATQNQIGAPPPTPTPNAPARYILKGPDVTDPFMLKWHGRYYIYTSEGTSFMNVPVRVGPKPGDWGTPTDALPKLPSWATGGLTWAPDVHQVAGGWALYFTALLRDSPDETHCIGSAFSSSPTGPFVPTDRTLICQLDHRGSIDPRVFVDGKNLIMLWKSEDNADPNVPGPDQNGKTGIYSQFLSANGRTLLGQPTKIFGPSQSWEGTIVEAPDMVEAWGTYWLFFSGNWYYSASYGIGVAACETPFGPCADVSPKPFLGSNSQGLGPGEESIFVNGANAYLLYNPFRANDPGPVIPRPVVMARLGFTPDGPYLAKF